MFPSVLSIQEARPALFSTTSCDQVTLMLGFSEHVFLPSCIPIKVDILSSICSVFLFSNCSEPVWEEGCYLLVPP